MFARIALFLAIGLSPATCFAQERCWVSTTKNCQDLAFPCDPYADQMTRLCHVDAECGYMSQTKPLPNMNYSTAVHNDEPTGGLEGRMPTITITCGKIRQCFCLQSFPIVRWPDGLVANACWVKDDVGFIPNTIQLYTPYGSWHVCGVALMSEETE